MTISSKSSLTVVSAAIFILLGQSHAQEVKAGATTQSAPRANRLVSLVTYDRVVDAVFETNDATRGFSLVLRFQPSNAPELQLVIKTGPTTEVLEYKSISGNIYRKLNEVLANGGEEDPIEMAKLIQVRRRHVDVPEAQIRQWRADLVSSMAGSMKVFEQRNEEWAKGTGTLVLDGTLYSLRYKQAVNSFSIEAWDHEVSDREVTGLLPHVRWMNTVRRAIEGM